MTFIKYLIIILIGSVLVTTLTASAQSKPQKKSCYEPCFTNPYNNNSTNVIEGSDLSSPGYLGGVLSCPAPFGTRCGYGYQCNGVIEYQLTTNSCIIKNNPEIYNEYLAPQDDCGLYDFDCDRSKKCEFPIYVLANPCDPFVNKNPIFCFNEFGTNIYANTEEDCDRLLKTCQKLYPQDLCYNLEVPAPIEGNSFSDFDFDLPKNDNMLEYTPESFDSCYYEPQDGASLNKCFDSDPIRRGLENSPYLEIAQEAEYIEPDFSFEF
jgi:hypothetical protein